MNIIDRIFVGKVVYDFGPLQQKGIGLGKIDSRLLLIERRGKRKVVLRRLIWFLFSASVTYHEFSPEEAIRLRSMLDESEQILKNLPPTDYDPAGASLRNSLIFLLFGVSIFLIARDPILISLVAMIVSVLLVHEYWDQIRGKEISHQSK